jgi:AcrR family transcriptional regulator
MTTSTTPSMRLTGPQRREQILDVTRAIVGEKGFHAISIDGVAKRAGITRPVVYGHFEDLSGLLKALVERENMRAINQLMELLPRPEKGADTGAILTSSLRAFLEAVQAEPITWRLVLMPPEGTPAVLREQVVATRALVTQQLAQVAPQALAGSGREPSPDPELTALSLQAISEDCARLLLEDPEQYPIDRLVEHARWLLGLLDL